MVFNIGQPSSRGNSKSKGLSDYKDGSNLQEYNNGCQQLFLRSLEKPSPVIIIESKMILFNFFQNCMCSACVEPYREFPLKIKNKGSPTLQQGLPLKAGV